MTAFTKAERAVLMRAAGMYCRDKSPHHQRHRAALMLATSGLLVVPGRTLTDAGRRTVALLCLGATS